MRVIRLCWICRVVIVVLLLSLTLFAQTGTARLAGRVTDPQGRVVSGAVVEAVNNGTNVKTTTETNGDGLYFLPSLPTGNYRVIISKEGFKQIIQADLALHTQDELTLNFGLQLGSASETVTVSGTVGTVPISDSPAVGILVTREFVDNMPLNGRSLQDLIALAPGALVSADGNGTNHFSINGQRDDANYYTVDGVAANIDAGNPSNGITPSLAGSSPSLTALGTTQSLVSVDALQEFRIQTSGYTAEYGRQPGGQVAFTTRSGTNDLHGSLFDYFRNEALDANSWFNNDHGIPRQVERQNDFGGTIGGPITIPGLYNGKDRTFVFFSYEGLRLRIPGSVRSDVPTTSLRGSAAPGAQSFLNAYPVPNGPPDGNDVALFIGGFSNPSSLNSTSIRLDHNLTRKLQLFARYAYTPSQITARFQLPQTNTVNIHTLTVGATAALSEHMVNELRFNYSTSSDRFRQIPDSFGNATPVPMNDWLPSQYVSKGTGALGFASLNLFGDNIPCCYSLEYLDEVNKQKQYNLVDSFSLSKGQHFFKFGGDYRRLIPSVGVAQYESVFVIGSLASVQQGVADVLFLSATAASRPAFDSLSLYAQDRWAVSPRFSVDYGLRWEFDPAPGNTSGKAPLAVNQVADLATMQLAPVGTAVYKTSYRNFAPRIGLACQIHESNAHPLVFRAGAGLFYDTGQSQAAAPYNSYPFSNSSIQFSVPLPAPLSALAPPSLSIPTIPPYNELFVTDPHLRLPYTEQWNLSLDQGLAKKNTLSISYVGNNGKRLLYSQLYFPTDNPDFANGVGITNNAASSTYHALQVQDRGELARGMDATVSWTLAHAIDNVSTDAQAFFAPVRGNSDNDVRQVFNAAVNYRVPYVSSNHLSGVLTKGWSLGWRISAQSGYPYNIVQGSYSDPINGASLTIVADRVPGIPVYLHNQNSTPGGWAVNPAAFVPSPVDSNGRPLRPGSSGRNFVHGPNVWQVNASLQRDFDLVHERLRLVFRTEAFNLFNHANLEQLNSQLGTTSFGQLIGTLSTFLGGNPLYQYGASRSLQVSLKLQF